MYWAIDTKNKFDNEFTTKDKNTTKQAVKDAIQFMTFHNIKEATLIRGNETRINYTVKIYNNNGVFSHEKF